MIEKREMFYKDYSHPYTLGSRINILQRKYFWGFIPYRGDVTHKIIFIGNDSSARLLNKKNGKEITISCSVKIYEYDYEVKTLYDLTDKGVMFNRNFINIPLGSHNNMGKINIDNLTPTNIANCGFGELHILSISKNKKAVLVKFIYPFNQFVGSTNSNIVTNSQQWMNINTEFIIVDSIKPR